MFDASFHQSQQGKVIRKRNRIPVSCIPCRAKRSKCDRGHPCSRCIQNGHPETCQYVTKPNHQNQPFSSGRESLPQDAGSYSEGRNEAAISTGKDIQERDGRQWNVVLEDLNSLSPEPDPQWTSLPPLGDSPVSLFAVQRSMPWQELLGKYLPTRENSDRLLSRYFGCQYGPLPILHKSHYAKNYLAWWSSDQKQEAPLFLSTLFSAFCIGLIASRPYNDDSFDQLQRFNFAAVQCLIYGDFKRPQPWLIEALLMHFHMQYISSLDPPREICVLVPYLTRLVHEMGLNREPGPKISPFVAEMRRRHFVAVQHFDVLLAYQTGMPISLTAGTFDIHEPHNLYDEDFDDESDILPPSRPDTDAGLILCFIVKHRLMNVFTKIYQLSIALQPMSEHDIATLDAEAREEHAKIPKPLKLRPLSQSFIDSQVLIMTRLNCEFLAQRSICVLHRKAMVAGNLQATRKCVEAAILIIEALADIHKEILPGGLVSSYGRMISSTMINDFFLASMILCFATTIIHQAKSQGSPITGFEAAERVPHVLQQSHRISNSISNMSLGAKKVAHAVGKAMARLGSSTTHDLSHINSERSEPSSAGGVSLYDSVDPMLVDSRQSSLLEDSDSPVESIWSNPDFLEMLNDPTGIDWSSLDQFLNLPPPG